MTASCNIIILITYLKISLQRIMWKIKLLHIVLTFFFCLKNPDHDGLCKHLFDHIRQSRQLKPLIRGSTHFIDVIPKVHFKCSWIWWGLLDKINLQMRHSVICSDYSWLVDLRMVQELPFLSFASKIVKIEKKHHLITKIKNTPDNWKIKKCPRPSLTNTSRHHRTFPSWNMPAYDEVCRNWSHQ